MSFSSKIQLGVKFAVEVVIDMSSIERAYLYLIHGVICYWFVNLALKIAKGCVKIALYCGMRIWVAFFSLRESRVLLDMSWNWIFKHVVTLFIGVNGVGLKKVYMLELNLLN